MVGGSAFMYHFTQATFKSAPLPNMQDILKDNPDLMKQFQSAAMNSASKTNPMMGMMGNMMGMGGGGGGGGGLGGLANMMSGFMGGGGGDMGGGGGGSPKQRKEMSGPTGFDGMMGDFMNNAGLGRGQDDDVRSVSLSELNDADRISEVSSLNENEIGDQDLSFDNNDNKGGAFKRPGMGIRANNREALINRLKEKKKKSNGGGGSGGVTIDL